MHLKYLFSITLNLFYDLLNNLFYLQVKALKIAELQFSENDLMIKAVCQTRQGAEFIWKWLSI